MTRCWRLLDTVGRPHDSPVPGTLGGHRRGRIYGRLDCPSALRAIARGGYVRDRVFFLDEATAVAAGYRPCAVCLPAAYARWRTSGEDGTGSRVQPRGAPISPAACRGPSSAGDNRSECVDVRTIVDGGAAVETRGLVRHYGDVEAVRGVDLRVEAGEVFGFLGPNGAGTSTTVAADLLALGRRPADQGLLGRDEAARRSGLRSGPRA